VTGSYHWKGIIAFFDSGYTQGPIEAINGLIVFGLTTAFFFAAIQRAWPPRV